MIIFLLQEVGGKFKVVRCKEATRKLDILRCYVFLFYYSPSLPA